MPLPPSPLPRSRGKGSDDFRHCVFLAEGGTPHTRRPDSPSPAHGGGGWGVGATLTSLLILLACLLPSPAHAQQSDAPVLDGIPLERTAVGGVALYYDPDVDRET